MHRAASTDSSRLVLAAAQNSTPKWVKDLNIKPNTLNLREKKVGNGIDCTSI